MPGRTNKTDDVTIETWARLLRVSRNLLERVEAALKRDGFPPLSWYDVLLELHKLSDEVLKEEAAKSEKMKKIYESFTVFKAKTAPWTRVSEEAFLEARSK